jgi:hypothetical protein
MSRLVRPLARKLGVEVIPTWRWHAMQAERCRMLSRLRDATPVRAGGAEVAAVVFSKDRPAQLAALLASMGECVTPAVPVRVLYAAGDDRFARAYAEVLEAFAPAGVEGRRESRFRDDLPRLLAENDAPRVFFLVDDIVFTEPVDLTPLLRLDLATHVPSLRLGRNLERCYTADRPQPLPRFEPLPGCPGLLSWRWSEGLHDWGYPLSVDGNLFDAREMAVLAEIADYKAPNSFEVALQHFSACFDGRLGVCFEKSRLLNIPCNKVQDEVPNRAGTVDPVYLLERWEAGFGIDHRRFRGFGNASAHQELPLSLVPRGELGYCTARAPA